MYFNKFNEKKHIFYEIIFEVKVNIINIILIYKIYNIYFIIFLLKNF